MINTSNTESSELPFSRIQLNEKFINVNNERELLAIQKYEMNIKVSGHLCYYTLTRFSRFVINFNASTNNNVAGSPLSSPLLQCCYLFTLLRVFRRFLKVHWAKQSHGYDRNSSHEKAINMKSLCIVKKTLVFLFSIKGKYRRLKHQRGSYLWQQLLRKLFGHGDYAKHNSSKNLQLKGIQSRRKLKASLDIELAHIVNILFTVSFTR